MTLRVLIQIVPFGDEERVEDLYRLDVSNTGLIKDLGFGHQICSYSVKLLKKNNKTMQRLLHSQEWELEQEGVVKEHDRRDGPLVLVQTALEELNE